MTDRRPAPLTQAERDRLQHLIRRAARQLGAEERGALLRLWERQQAQQAEDQQAAETRNRQLTAALDEVLRGFVHPVHPGYAGLQSRMEPAATVQAWRAVLMNTTKEPTP